MAALDLILPTTNQSFESKEDDCPEMLMHYFNIQFSLSLIFLLGMIFHLPEMENKQNMDLLAVSLRQLGPFRLGHLLRAFLFKEFKGLSDSESLALVRVLLNAGADPNVYVSEDFGNACLHVAATLRDRDLSDAICQLLVEFGAKPHLVNRAGKTALDIWIDFNESEGNWNEKVGGRTARPEWWCPLPTLSRLAARVIRNQKIPYVDGEMPTTLHGLIELR